VNAEPLMSGFCHCLDCQKSSGASRVMHVAFPAAALEVSGATAKFVSTADSGGTVTREFCPVCGSRLFGSSTTMPGMKTVHASVFDNPAGFAPMMSVYVKRMQPWDHAEPNLPAFEAMPPMP
jgi:hypothetical protein